MKGVLFELKGNWGHFRKPETNNNPLTHEIVKLISEIDEFKGFYRAKRSGADDLLPFEERLREFMNENGRIYRL